MLNDITLRKEELKGLLDLCEIFQKDYVKVSTEPGGGIGYLMYGEVETEVNGVAGTFKVEITGVDSW